MTDPAPLSATARFALIIDGLCASVAKQIAARTMTATLIVLIWQRLRRINTRFQALAALIRAGKVVVRATGPRREGDGGRCMPVKPSSPPLPRGFAWLLPLVPYDAACLAEGLRRVFAEPEMEALIAATPRMERILRPLCHMLGIATDFLPASRARRDATSATREARPDGSRLPVRRERKRFARGRTKMAELEAAIRSDIVPWYEFLGST